MAKKIMIQGTASGVGKSILTIGLCRILKNKGFKVAPFKVQNLTNNYHKLDDGKIMARSQAIAAFACGIEPCVEMNPLLINLKNKIKIYLNGTELNILKDDYHKKLKTEIFDKVLESYKKLDNMFDIIIIEGAGSPVELNLKENDIVNMYFAKKINSPVLIVSDISAGGVFANIYGTISLLSDEEKNLVKGIIINKFIGDKKLFQDAKEILKQLTSKEILGVIPYIKTNLEDEDEIFYGIRKKREEDRKILNIQIDELSENLEKNIEIENIMKILEV